MKSVLKGIGIALVIIGIIALITGIIMALTVGTYLVAVFLLASIVINTVGLVMMQYGKK